MADSAGLPRIEQGLEPGNDYIRSQLLDRRRRLAAIPAPGRAPGIGGLLREVDSALERFESGGYGQCGNCHDPIEPGRLLADPLIRVCLGCLNEKQQRALEHDLQLASVVQAALLPAERVREQGWEIEYRYLPLGAVSGDYCDVLPAGNGRSASHFILGDVSGKGVSASILMARLQAGFRALVSLDLPLAELAGRANRIFSEGTLSSSYATLLLGRLFPDGRLEFCNAGHCPPLLVRDGERTSLPATGLPLGLFSSSTYQVASFDLTEGDALFLHTDGLSEATDEKGRQLGDDLIEQAAAGLGKQGAGGVLDRCLEELKQQMNDAPREDDLTLMTVRREEACR
jgi:sigma-B regulation protein RsbU (phosphoserine phosphatase)